MNINVFWMKGQQSKSKKRRNSLGANTGREEKRHLSFSGENDKTWTDRKAQRARARQLEVAEGSLFTPPPCTES